MKKAPFIICLLLAVTVVSAQKDTAVLNDISRFQKELLNEYATDATSPLSADAKKKFKGIHFYAIDMQYVVTAKFTRTEGERLLKCLLQEIRVNSM
jgi:uncharacterized protein